MTLSVDEVIARGHLTVGDDAQFPRHIDVARLFGLDYKGHQQAVIKVSGDTVVWFPSFSAITTGKTGCAGIGQKSPCNRHPMATTATG